MRHRRFLCCTVLMLVIACVSASDLTARESCSSDPVTGFHGTGPLPEAHATFHAIGLYWKPNEGSSDNVCHVHVRPRGECKWREAEPLWFDSHTHKDNPRHSREYRGSLVDLIPGTVYEIKLSLDSGPTYSFPVETMSETFPIARTVTLQGTSHKPLEIQEGGSPDQGYVLYAAGDTGYTNDIKKAHDSNVLVNAPYVILRGLTLRGAARHGIRLGAVHHVVIEYCDISDWGSIVKSGKYTGFGTNFDSAIYSNDPALAYTIIQRNRLHHPTYDTNAWDEFGDFDHPQGPQGITLHNSTGHHVIRYNHIYSDEDHKFNDGMGEWRNFSYTGFPNRDSDIYGNHVSHVWDDAIEAEGSGMNVRVWSNYVDRMFIAFGLATQSLGPLYLYRNVSGYSQRGPVESNKHKRVGPFAKIGSEPDKADYAHGQIVVYHNTVLQPPSRWAETTSGCYGIHYSTSQKRQDNIRSRNNIFEVRVDNDYAIRDHHHNPTNDFDYDLTNGRLDVASNQQRNRISGKPRYASGSAAFEYYLAPDSPGYDAAVLLPGFNDAFAGEKPDIGAFETGAPPPRFGITADWTEWCQWVSTHR